MSVFRREYRPLTAAETRWVNNIKSSAEHLYDYLTPNEQLADPERLRMLALARTKLEECVMWATKAIT